MILSRFILKLAATRILGALLVLFAILQILDLLDVTTDVLDRGLGMAGLLQYAALRSPGLIVQAIPLAVLAGSLFAFAQLARENAIVAMRAGGISMYRIVRLAAPVALVAVLVHLVVGMAVVPAAGGALDRWWRASEPVAEREDPTTRSFRVGSDLVTATAEVGQGDRLTDVRIYRRSNDGDLVQRTTAATAIHADGRWTLGRVQRVDVTGATASTSDFATLAWNTTLTPADIDTAYSRANTVTAAQAQRALTSGASVRSPTYYRMRLLRAWAEPMASLVMLLLAAPVALVNFRSGRAPTVMALGLAAGLFYLVVDGLLTAMGESGAAPILIAAWAAPVLFIMSGVAVLLRLEG